MDQELLSRNPNDVQFCWEQVERVRPLFRLSYVYSTVPEQARLLALYALLCALEEPLYSVSDPEVIRAKIAWFHQELLGENFETSNHPVIRLVYQSGAIPHEGFDVLHQHIDSTLNRIEPETPSDETEFRSLCTLGTRSAAKLELYGIPPGFARDADMLSACALSGLVQLLRESSRKSSRDFTWVPLYMRARHQLSLADLERGIKSVEIESLFRDLSDTGLSWFTSKNMQELCAASSQSGLSRNRFNHWLIQLKLQRNLLERVRELKLSQHNKVFSTVWFGGAWQTWRFARKLNWQGLSKR